LALGIALATRLCREVKDLLFFFDGISMYGTIEDALTAFYVYESQVPRVSGGEIARA